MLSRGQLIALCGGNGGGTGKPEETKSAKYTANGNYEVVPTAGKTMKKVNVEVAVPSDQKPEQAKTVEITENGDVTISPDVGKVLSEVIAKVNVSDGGGGEEVLNSLIDRSITEISSSATSIGNYAFEYSSALTTVNFPAATSIGDYAFYRCSALTTVNFPAATSIGDNAFEYSSALTTVNFPAATSIGDYAFCRCSALTTVNFPAATSIGGYAFYRCSALTTLILRSPTLCEASGNPNLRTEAFIYVPKALLADYQAATNWSKYSAQFRAIEDYPDITGG